MASVTEILPSAAFRDEFARRGGESAARCYQCATCSSVCDLAPAEAPFPRRQVLWAQWGLADRLAADPGIWLCHQCNDCNLRCPRDVNPGDLMAAMRAMVVEKLAFPGFMGRLVANAKNTWPLLIGIPILFWVVLLTLTTGFAIPHVNAGLGAGLGNFHYEEFVPHILIYTVYLLIAAWVVLASWVSGRRFWKMTGAGAGAERRGSFLAQLVPAAVDVATHKKFASCKIAPKRRWGHFALMWGFVGAAVTSAIAIPYLYQHTPLFSWIPFKYSYPVPILHPLKWLGNISALALVVGGVLLYLNRRSVGDKRVGATTAFDRFFLWLVLSVIFTGVLTEVLRFVGPPVVGSLVYLGHLGVVMALFLTFPYSKFAHLIYRTLAMVHERMTTTTVK
jgi:quinone-modifying oxidoreductase, subunit QmoC